MDINILIHRSLTGQISFEEQAKLNAWLAADRTHQEIYDEIKFIWENAGDEEDGSEVNEAQFAEELTKLQTTVGVSEKKDALLKALRRNLNRLAVLSVSIALALAVTVLWPAVWQAPASPVRFSNASLDQVVLQDGSVVVLNDSSWMEYREGKDDRRVSLRGEAFFEVTPEDRPFKVSTPDLDVEVLGTSFIVKAYAGNPTEVFVISGKVKVSAGGKHLQVTKGEKASFNAAQIEKSLNENPNFDAWYSGMLEFKNAPLGEVLSQLESQYHVAFSIDEPRILRCRFTGKFANAKLDEVLRALSFSMNLTFSGKGQGMFAVSGDGCI